MIQFNTEVQQTVTVCQASKLRVPLTMEEKEIGQGGVTSSEIWGFKESLPELMMTGAWTVRTHQTEEGFPVSRLKGRWCPLTLPHLRDKRFPNRSEFFQRPNILKLCSSS